MPINKNALIRYKTIDRCLQNRFRKWTLNDLIQACSAALYEYEGKEVEVSKRTLQLDIQTMRSEKLGYHAPIEVYEKKYYRYADPNFSITDIPLNEQDMQVLSETVEMLRQFKDFSLFADVGGIIQRLEDKVYAEKTHQPAIIHLEKNEKLKGLEYLDTLYQAILKKTVLQITYQSFTAGEPSTFPFHPYILKEFNNRWFVVGRKEGYDKVWTLALDRLQQIDWERSIPYSTNNFSAERFYQNTYGVTVMSPAQLKTILLKIDVANAPYVLTKPFHHSQKLVEQYEDGSVQISIYVHHNLEIERLILGFGESVQVLAPKLLQKRIQRKLRKALAQYEPKAPE